jgi:hypothetical protein
MPWCFFNLIMTNAMATESTEKIQWVLVVSVDFMALNKILALSLICQHPSLSSRKHTS